MKELQWQKLLPKEVGNCVLKRYTNYKLLFLSAVRKQVPVNVQSELNSLRGRFGTVFLAVFSIVKTCSLEEMKDFLSAAFEELSEEVEMITSEDQLKVLLRKKSSFSNYSIVEELVTHLDLADAKKKLSDFEAFRDEKYKKILAERFAAEVADEYMKNPETQVCYV